MKIGNDAVFRGGNHNPSSSSILWAIQSKVGIFGVCKENPYVCGNFTIRGFGFPRLYKCRSTFLEFFSKFTSCVFPMLGNQNPCSQNHFSMEQISFLFNHIKGSLFLYHHGTRTALLIRKTDQENSELPQRGFILILKESYLTLF